MPIYTNINGNSKSISNLYDNINAAKKTNSAVYANINNSSKKIFPVEQTVYTWNRYVSYISDTKSTKTYKEDRNWTANVGTVKLSTQGKSIITAYSNYSFSEETGKFTLTGEKTFTSTYYTKYQHEWDPEDSTTQLTQMYMPYETYTGGIIGIRQIDSFHYPDAADSSYYYVYSQKGRKSSTTYIYTYSYKYDGTVTSTNPYAYSTAGNTSSYTSSSDNDIRTVYVRA